jgi:hypothetical protein
VSMDERDRIGFCCVCTYRTHCSLLLAADDRRMSRAV